MSIPLRLPIIFFIILSILPYSSKAEVIQDLSTREAKEYVKKLGDKCWKIRETETEKATELGVEAVEYAKAYNLNHELARISNFLGVIYIHYLFDTKEGISYLHQALEVSLYVKDSAQLGYAYNNLGDAFLLTGNVPLAQQYADNSLEIFENIKDTSGIAYAYINQGSVSRAEGDYDAAIEFFTKAKTLRELRGDKLGVASVILELGQTYHKQGALDKALSIYEDSFDHHVEINNNLYIAHTLKYIASVYLEKKQTAKAEEYYNEAIKLYEVKNTKVGLIDGYLGLALVYGLQGHQEKGEEILELALKQANSLGLPTKILETYETYTKFYQSLGKYKIASERSVQFLAIYDSILSTQQIETLNELQRNYSIEFNLGIAQQSLENEKIKERYFYYIITLMIVAVGFVLWRYRIHRKLNKVLEQTVQSKDKLFSVISHDLKNPFNSLLGFSEVLIDEVDDQEYENVKKYAKIINQAAEENLNLLTNLLNWSRSQTGQIKFNPVLIKLEDLFQEIKYFFASDVNSHRISIDFKSSIQKSIKVDPDILRIILVNLISNALKYTNENGSIEVLAELKHETVYIKVKDDGIGMSEATKEGILSTNQTQSLDGLREEKGTGLGLMICFELIQLHQGTLKVQSELGHGSTFIISFPLKF